MQPRFEVITQELLADVRVEAAQPLKGDIQLASPCDPCARVQRAEIKPAEAVPAVEREDVDSRRDAQGSAAGHACIAAEADGKLSNTCELQPADGGWISKGRLKTIAPAIPNALFGAKA